MGKSAPGSSSNAHLLTLLVSLFFVVRHFRVARHGLRQLRLQRLELGEDVGASAGRCFHPLLPTGKQQRYSHVACESLHSSSLPRADRPPAREGGIRGSDSAQL